MVSERFAQGSPLLSQQGNCFSISANCFCAVLRCAVVSDSLRPHGLYSPWNSPGKNTAVGSHALLQGIFPTQGSDLGLLHCRRILYRPSHQGSPILVCVCFCCVTQQTLDKHVYRNFLTQSNYLLRVSFSWARIF